MSHAFIRPVAGLATVVLIAGIIAIAATLFRGGFAETVPVTVLSQRAPPKSWKDLLPI